MLTARRDPLLHPGAEDRAHSVRDAHIMAGHPAPGSSRFMTAVQMIGTVLAIPVGLASAYSLYHSNFSTEAQCQSLRANIVSMLDKSADATTLRMLVRRDVAAFENTCGSVDPDAVAAFKTLLASGKPAPQPAPARAVAPAPQVAHEPARPLHEAAKPAPVKTAPAVTEDKPAPRDSATSDAKWVASVRDALVHAPAAHADAAEAPASAPAPAFAPAPAPVQAAAPPMRAPRDTQAPALSLAAPAPAPQEVAPALPPAAAVVAAPAPASLADHPVPPASIPDAAPAPTPTVAAQKPAPSGIRGVIAEIPLVGRWVKQ